MFLPTMATHSSDKYTLSTKTRPLNVHARPAAVAVAAVGYLPSFWIKLRNLDVTGPHLQLPWLSTEVCMCLGLQSLQPERWVFFISFSTAAVAKPAELYQLI